MRLEQVDQYCDLYEQRLKSGERLTPEQFLAEHQLPAAESLLIEFRKLADEYLREPLRAEPNPNRLPVDIPTTTMMVGAGPETRVGPYKLLQKIGEGGMGVVFMAEQLHPVSRRVALKIIKPGMDSKEVLARFEAERQALALMDHPHIARVLDAGTTEAERPYFVMELVKGVPITTYCTEKQLSTKERLELFIPICQAVQHAHQKGVIHRDLKPSNVLIAQYDNQPVPKIIDFGLAKAVSQRLTDKTMFTQFGQIVGTIDYMSPEQASFNQLDVDTRSDVYSLGVLLYELLTGETPFDKKRLHSAAIEEMLRIIRLEEPPRPSMRLSSHASLPSTDAKKRTEIRRQSMLIRGELDWIVMKAIDKERDRRYQTAAGLADDIHRYLTHEAVQACPPSISYRFQKFARRNKALLGSAGAVFVALLIGLASTSWGFMKAKRAETKLEGQVRELDQRNKHLRQQIQVSMSQAGYFDRVDQATSNLIERWMTTVDEHERSNNLQLAPLKRQLSEAAVQFWSELVAMDKIPTGGPGPRSVEHRTQRAMCLARSGDHQRAFQEVGQLLTERRSNSAGLYQLVQVCALCAAATGNDPEPAEFYVAEALKILSVAAQNPDTPPPALDDPDIAIMAQRDNFKSILKEWQHNWDRELEARQDSRHSL